MSLSAAHHHQVKDEEMALNTVPGCSEKEDTKNDCTSIHLPAFCGLMAASGCQDNHHRKLAIGSIICGITCIGIVALINSVKAEEATDPERTRYFSRRAKRCGIISIVVWVSILVCAPMLLALVSYLLTLID